MMFMGTPRDELAKPAGRGGKERRADLCGLCPFCRANRGCNGGKRRGKSDRYKNRRKGK